MIDGRPYYDHREEQELRARRKQLREFLITVFVRPAILFGVGYLIWRAFT
jgi:hypothetical protein